MALYKETGTLTFVSEITSGISKSGNEWQRQTIVVEIPGYQGSVKRIALSVSNREMGDVSKFNIGDHVQVEFYISAREWNGKWFNDVSLFSIDPANQQTPAAQPQRPQAQPQARPQAVNYSPADLDPAEHTDDLPW